MPSGTRYNSSRVDIFDKLTLMHQTALPRSTWVGNGTERRRLKLTANVVPNSTPYAVSGQVSCQSGRGRPSLAFQPFAGLNRGGVVPRLIPTDPKACLT